MLPGWGWGGGIGLRFESRAGQRGALGRRRSMSRDAREPGHVGWTFLSLGRARLRKAFRPYLMKLFQFCLVVFVMLMSGVLLY